MQRIRQGVVWLLARLLVWPRRWLSWVAGLGAAVAMTLIVVPGTPENYWTSPLKTPPAPKGAFSCYYSHGWPLAFLDRRVSLADYEAERAAHTPLWSYSNSAASNVRQWYSVSWSIPKAWIGSQKANELRRWRPLALLLDAGVGLLVVLGVAVAAEAWLRSRRGWFQIRLVDLLLAPAVIAVPLVWWHGHVTQTRLHGQAEQLAELVERQRNPNYLNMVGFLTGRNWCDATPRWLHRLLGTRSLTPWCRHLERCSVYAGFEGETAERQWRACRRLKYLEVLKVEGPPTRATLDRLQEMACLRRLKNVAINFANTRVDYDFNTKVETTVFIGPELTEPVDLRPLLNLPRLEALSIRSRHVKLEHVEQLLAAAKQKPSALKKIWIAWVRLAEADFERLKELAGPAVTIYPPSSFAETRDAA